MSVNQQDLDPDSTTDMEDITDAEEKLIKECEELWKDMEGCQKKLSLVGTETLTDSNAQLSLLIMQAKCLTAELSQWQKESPEIISLNEEVLVTLGKEEFQKLRVDLELVLSTVQSKNEKLKEDLEREQQWLDEQQQILESLNVLHNKLKQQVVTFSESRVFDELNTKMHDIKEYKEKLLITLGEFLEDHFPLPDGNVKKKKKNVKESTAQLITLHEILEILINRLFDVPHDPYIKIRDSFWPPYIELLLRNGIALRHPEDPTQIRLEAFHQ
ncbi:centromere protein K [Canis lupus baileyi]|uniref:Centromere protein K n=3 Tax=Canis lupus familiaris TaxID=9615 RepID=A0A8C0M286_CANLF|nr:centromere protein K isoform X1 [Canis lupus familiaris]XP_025304210.1 centromere protein K [Canis lupus dingo]XP_025304211.1 centromere protein K [Canis lupus dingo]XP_038386677.1 centromere protein K isoform X1 [Canis lupus familiaris]XP_038386678.1 centromere protein K isoform X1 [Canis lupus familiaris]XP_038514974.1 centromere protein K isoform X1 [Canis lupus familiaris]XP_038514976.1 centromere protein K isoform X1 [Canis lupus familiaris]XP_048959283.1 centromere protein K [Canis |eukprot:XP_022265771.1 centromere protein K [Canis lupus familiaris]